MNTNKHKTEKRAETLGMQAKSCGTTYKSINVNIIIEIVVTLHVVVVAVVGVVLVVVVGIVQRQAARPWEGS